METGQRTILKNNNISTHNLNILSIQVSLNGLSFCVLNNDTNSIVFYHSIPFNKKQTPAQLLDKLVDQFNTIKQLQQEFSKVTVIHENELSTLVPNALFNEEYLADYLKFNTRILKSDFITYDPIVSIDSVNVYMPYVNINNYIYEHFGEFEYRHFSTVLLDRILAKHKRSNKDVIVVHVETNHFEIIISNGNALQLYNSFEYHTKEDFIYYILFTAEQLQLNPEEIELQFVGKINKEDELYAIAYKYVRHVNFLDVTSDYNIEDDQKDVLNNFILLHSF